MKYLLTLFSFLPLLACGQTFDVGVRGGYGTICNKTGFLPNYHIVTGGVSVGYSPLKHWKINAWYDREFDRVGLYQSAGVGPEFISKYFFVGADLTVSGMNGFRYDDHHDSYGSIMFEPCLGGGLHAGLRQKLGKRFCLTEQGAYNFTKVHGYETDYLYPLGGGAVRIDGPPTPLGRPYPVNGRIKYYSLVVGMSYRLSRQ